MTLGDRRTGPIHIHFETSPRARPSQAMTPDRVAPLLAELGEADGWLRLTYNNDPERTGEYLRTAEVLMVAGPVDLEGLADRAPRLRWLQLSSAGVETIARHAPKDVALTNVRGVHSARAAEFGILSLLMLNNRIPAFATQQQEHLWHQRPSNPIAGKTVSILGLGALGGSCAQWAKTFAMTVIGVRRDAGPHRFADEVLSLAEIGAAFARSDFVVITLPLTDETRNCIGRRELDQLPAHAGLVNIGRAAVLDHAALVAKLRDGSLAGAVLDVFPQEPLPADSELWDVPNLLITPHCGLDDESDYGLRCLAVFRDNLQAYLAGQPFKTAVDVKRGY